MWWECEDCVFASNSERAATKHVEETGHDVFGEVEK